MINNPEFQKTNINNPESIDHVTIGRALIDQELLAQLDTIDLTTVREYLRNLDLGSDYKYNQDILEILKANKVITILSEEEFLATQQRIEKVKDLTLEIEKTSQSLNRTNAEKEKLQTEIRNYHASLQVLDREMLGAKEKVGFWQGNTNSMLFNFAIQTISFCTGRLRHWNRSLNNLTEKQAKIVSEKAEKNELVNQKEEQIEFYNKNLSSLKEERVHLQNLEATFSNFHCVNNNLFIKVNESGYCFLLACLVLDNKFDNDLSGIKSSMPLIMAGAVIEHAENVAYFFNDFRYFSYDKSIEVLFMPFLGDQRKLANIRDLGNSLESLVGDWHYSSTKDFVKTYALYHDDLSVEDFIQNLELLNGMYEKKYNGRIIEAFYKSKWIELAQISLISKATLQDKVEKFQEIIKYLEGSNPNNCDMVVAANLALVDQANSTIIENYNYLYNQLISKGYNSCEASHAASILMRSNKDKDELLQKIDTLTNILSGTFGDEHIIQTAHLAYLATFIDSDGVLEIRQLLTLANLVNQVLPYYYNSNRDLNFFKKKYTANTGELKTSNDTDTFGRSLPTALFLLNCISNRLNANNNAESMNGLSSSELYIWQAYHGRLILPSATLQNSLIQNDITQIAISEAESRRRQDFQEESMKRLMYYANMEEARRKAEESARQNRQRNIGNPMNPHGF